MEVFEAEERAVLTPLEAERFVIPCWDRCQVHPDHHVRFLYALYSVPTQYVGKEVDVRGDGALVRIYHQAQLIKTHAQKPRGGRSTTTTTTRRSGPPMPCATRTTTAKRGRRSARPWVCSSISCSRASSPGAGCARRKKLLRLAERYGAARVEAACVRALSYEAIDVHRLGHILEQGLEHESSENPQASSPPVSRRCGFFVRHTTSLTKPISPGVTPCKQRLN